MDLTMFTMTVDYKGNTLLTTLPCDPYELEDQLGSIGLAHSQESLKFGTLPDVSLRVAPMDRRGVLMEPLIDGSTSVFDLNRACVGIYRADWRDEDRICTKLAEEKYSSIKEVADDCKCLHDKRHAKGR